MAVSRMIQKYLDAKSAREADQTSDLQTVLGLMAWAGAVRLRVAGAHVLDRMDAMPASLKVPLLCLPTVILYVYRTPSVAARHQSLPEQLAGMPSATLQIILLLTEYKHAVAHICEANALSFIAQQRSNDQPAWRDAEALSLQTRHT